jgi:hypothetical protein
MSPTNQGYDEYDRARKRGLREFSLAKARGESGYLPVLDSKREENGVLGFIAQPMRPISLNRIAGTYQASRANSFAPNFMPLLSPDTEFANKWINLCNAHLESGIRDPIRVYEYLWKYYVAEGNKRVSVLKYFEASSFEAEITRLVPQLRRKRPRHRALLYVPCVHEKGRVSGYRAFRIAQVSSGFTARAKVIAELDPAADPRITTRF